MELGRLIFGSDWTPHFLSGLNDHILPWFPFNTDGIDIGGENVLIERLNITNFDDAVTVKASTLKNSVATCSKNITVRDCEIWYSVGMSIGSITPSDYFSCVDDVKF